jgi:hypothetical protein
MRLNGDLYEYVATYVDDLCHGMLDPKSFTDTLQKKYNFKLKGTGPIDFQLGQSFSRNNNGDMEISAKCYVDKMIDTYVQLYGEKPRKASSPLEQNDHLEMDDSPFLRQDQTQQFQSLIGAMQWAIGTDHNDGGQGTEMAGEGNAAGRDCGAQHGHGFGCGAYRH